MPRSTAPALGLALGLVVTLPSLAFAHTGAGPTHSLLHGFAHPLAGLDHLLAMLAVGLWAGQRGGRAVWALPLAFVVAMLAAGAVGVAGVGLAGVELGIAASVVVLGVLIATAARPPLVLGVAAVALFAVFHGHAHGAEMAAGASAAAYGAGFALATAMLHAAGIGAVMAARQSLDARRPVWIRAAGAAIGVAGIAFLI